MKKIDAFVNSVYQDIGGNKKEIQELQAEMRSHLIESVHVLKTEGKSEQDAIEIAIERFGGEKEMRLVVGQLFKAQKTFAHRVLYTAIVCILFSTLIFSIVMPIEKINSVQINEKASDILNSLGDNERIPTKLDDDIQEIVQSNGRITGISIYDYNEFFSPNPEVEPIFGYRDDGLFNIWNNTGFLSYNAYGISNDNWQVSIEYKSYEGTAIILLTVGIVIYWTLFTIWATVNAYHHRRLNIWWLIVFVILNILGYLIYRIVGKKQLSKTNS